MAAPICPSSSHPESWTNRLPSHGGTAIPSASSNIAPRASSVRPIPVRVAVGTRVTPRPPHGSVRAPLCIRLLPRVLDGETLVGPGMKDSRLWEPVVSQLRHSSPAEIAFLAASAECPAPAFGDLGSKGSQPIPFGWDCLGIKDTRNDLR